MGLRVSIPIHRPSRRRAHASVRGRRQGRHIILVRGDRGADLNTRGRRPRAAPLPSVRLRRSRVPATGPRGNGIPSGPLRTRPPPASTCSLRRSRRGRGRLLAPAELRAVHPSQAVPPSLWSTAPSLRASATLARRAPRRFATSRIDSSRSSSLPSRIFRPPSSARISCAAGALPCTGRYQPIRSSCAMPRASRRSVFTTMADSAAFTCRVSSRTVSCPAAVSPACSHCDSGPFTAVP